MSKNKKLDQSIQKCSTPGPPCIPPTPGETRRAPCPPQSRPCWQRQSPWPSSPPTRTTWTRSESERGTVEGLFSQIRWVLDHILINLLIIQLQILQSLMKFIPNLISNPTNLTYESIPWCGIRGRPRCPPAARPSRPPTRLDPCSLTTGWSIRLNTEHYRVTHHVVQNLPLTSTGGFAQRTLWLMLMLISKLSQYNLLALQHKSQSGVNLT